MDEFLTLRPKSIAGNVFQQCLVEVSNEAKQIHYLTSEISGYFLEDLKPTPLSNSVYENTLKIIDKDFQENEFNVEDPFLKNLPVTLQRFIGEQKLKWKKFGNVKIANISSGERGSESLDLIHVMPGGSIPEHTHEGKENFLVLHGSYSDEFGQYTKGSLQIRDEDHNHKPVGDKLTGCIGLAYMEGKIKLSGTFGKFLNVFLN